MIKTNNEISGFPPKTGDFLGWIKSQADKEKRPFLLAFCDDGVVWGGFTEKGFQTSEGMDGISPVLALDILHEAHVFGGQDEVRLFKDEAGQWQARIISDQGAEVIVESQILWGSRAYASKDGFTRVFDARQQGLDHIVPLEVVNTELDPDAGGKKCLRLEVHHQVEYDPISGEARIALSRLAGLTVSKKDMEVAK